jgi:hypothetical protein
MKMMVKDKNVNIAVTLINNHKMFIVQTTDHKFGKVVGAMLR